MWIGLDGKLNLISSLIRNLKASISHQLTKPLTAMMLDERESDNKICLDNWTLY